MRVAVLWMSDQKLMAEVIRPLQIERIAESREPIQATEKNRSIVLSQYREQAIFFVLVQRAPHGRDHGEILQPLEWRAVEQARHGRFQDLLQEIDFAVDGARTRRWELAPRAFGTTEMLDDGRRCSALGPPAHDPIFRDLV